MIIGPVGDLEGDRDWAVSRLRALGERGDADVACQLGDLRFGMGEHHQDHLAALKSVCAEHDLRLVSVGGNHENGIEWRPSEVILDHPLATTLAGGHAEVILTHDRRGRRTAPHRSPTPSGCWPSGGRPLATSSATAAW